MSFPIANPVVAVVADAEYDGLFTLTCSGLDNTPNKTLATPIKISNKYECALLSADYENLKTGDNKRFTLQFKDIPMSGPLYTASGAFDANKDNVVDNHSSPVYRGFTMANDTEYNNIELEIVDDTGMYINGDASYGASYFVIHIRHKEAHRRDEFIQAITASTDASNQSILAVKFACDLIKDAVDLQKIAQDSTKQAVDQNKQSVNLVKVSCDTIATATTLVKTAVDQCKTQLDASLVLVKASCDSVHDAVDEAKASAVTNKMDLQSSLAQVKASCDTIDASAQAVKASVDSAKAGIEAKIDASKASAEADAITLNSSLGQIKSATDLVKGACDGVTASVNVAKAGIEGAVQASSTAIVQATEDHKAISQAMSNKIRYKLLH